jgi:hypothetical protein
MLTSAAFTVVVINDQSPRLIASFEPFCDCRNSVILSLASIMIMVECNIDIAPFVIYRLNWLLILLTGWPLAQHTVITVNNIQNKTCQEMYGRTKIFRNVGEMPLVFQPRAL